MTAEPLSSSSSSAQEVSPFQSALESLLPAFEEEEEEEEGAGSSGRESATAAAEASSSSAAEAGNFSSLSASASASASVVPMRALVAALSEGNEMSSASASSSLRSRVRKKVSSAAAAAASSSSSSSSSSFSAKTTATTSAASAVCGPLLLYSLLRCCPAFRERALPSESSIGASNGPTEGAAAKAAALALPLLRALYEATTLPKGKKASNSNSVARRQSSGDGGLSSAPHASEHGNAACAPHMQQQQQLYMLLVDLLLLSQEHRWSAASRGRAPRATVALYLDALLPKNGTSVAALAACVLLRAAHAALSRGAERNGSNSSASSGPDVYLLTTALAALANLTPAASPLPAHAAGRLVRLFERLDARYGRLSSAAASLAAASAASSSASRLRAAAEAAAAEAGIYEDLVRISLEIVSSALLHGLPCRRGGGNGNGNGRGGNGNEAPASTSHFDLDPLARLLPAVTPPTEPRDGADLSYALLHRAEAFARRAAHPRLGDAVAGIVAACSHFAGAVDAARGISPNSSSSSPSKSLLPLSAASPSRYYDDSLDEIGEAEAAAAVRGALATWHPSPLMGSGGGGGGGSSANASASTNSLPQQPSDLRFSYEEEEGADTNFFSPAAWGAALAATSAGVGWRRSAVRLFDDDDDDEGGEGREKESEEVEFFDPNSSSSSRGQQQQLTAARASASSLDDLGSNRGGREGEENAV